MLTHTYTIIGTRRAPDITCGPADPGWAEALPAALDHFRPEGSTHRPETELRMLHDQEALYGLFSVKDRYVRSVVTDFMGPVCTDSCVEFFVAPRPGNGYLNFEFNAGGTMHCSHVRNPRRVPDKAGFADWRPFSVAEAQAIGVASSLPAVVDPEITEPVDWWLTFRIPFRLVADVMGVPVAPVNTPPWRANFYKCGDRTSHPHWATWAPVPELNFHRPDAFGSLRFG